MRGLFKLFGAGSLATLVSLQSLSVAAEVLVWASDNRSGTPTIAEQSEWMKFLQIQAATGDTPLVTPNGSGVADQYPLHLQAEADVGALMTSRLATGSDAAVWVQLTNNGLQWVLEQGGQAQQLRTPATSDGLSLGLNWIGMQMSMAPMAAAQESAPTAATQPVTTPLAAIDPSATANPSSVTSSMPAASAPYQHPGSTQVISGLFDASDYLRLTASIRALDGVDYVYAARIDSTEVELVIGSAMPPYQIQAMLAQQPWLRRDDQGGLRWDALAMPLPQNQVQTGLAPSEPQAQ